LKHRETNILDKDILYSSENTARQWYPL